MENIVQSNNILGIIAKMSQQEVEKLSEILRVMGRFEEEKTAAVLSAEEVQEQGARWLEELKETAEKPHNFILSIVTGRCEAKIHKEEKRTADFQEKISAREGKINGRKAKIQRCEDKIEQLRQEMNRIDTGNNFLVGILGGRHDGAARLVIATNKNRQMKLQKQISTLNLKIAGHQGKIDLQSAKIEGLTVRISASKLCVEKQLEKVQRVNEIIGADMPHAALSFFLSERSGLDIARLNQAIENPVEFFAEDNEKLSEANIPQPQNSLENSERMELYAQYQGVGSSLEGEISAEAVRRGDLQELAEKQEGVLYKEVTAQEMKNLDGCAFVYRADDETTGKFIIKYNESESARIEAALKPPANQALPVL